MQKPAETPQTSSAAVKRDHLCFPEQSMQVYHQSLLKAQMILLKAVLAAGLVYAIAMNTLISALPSWPYNYGTHF